MSKINRVLFPAFVVLLVEVIVYLLISGGVKFELYVFLCAAISIGALLLKITNLGGEENPLNIVRPEHHEALRKMNDIFEKTSKRRNVSKYDSLCEVLSYLIVVCVNCGTVCIVG